VLKFDVKDKLHTTLTTPNYTDSDVDRFLNGVYTPDLNGRDFELWLPFFAISFAISIDANTKYPNLFSDVLALSGSKTNLKEEDALESDVDTSFAVTLHNLLVSKKEQKTTTDEIIKAHQEVNGHEDWLNSKWVGRALKRLNVIKKKCRLRQGYEYILSLPNLEKYLEARHALEIITQQEHKPEDPQTKINVPLV
jgi:hypothetical protein